MLSAKPRDRADHVVALGQFDGSAVCVGHGLGPVDDHAHDAIGVGHTRIDQTLGLDQEVQSIDVCLAGDGCHDDVLRKIGKSA